MSLKTLGDEPLFCGVLVVGAVVASFWDAEATSVLGALVDGDKELVCSVMVTAGLEETGPLAETVGVVGVSGGEFGVGTDVSRSEGDVVVWMLDRGEGND